MSLKEVMNGTSQEVRDLIGHILKIEKQYKHIENISSSKAAEAEITEAILQVIYKGGAR